MDIRTGLGRTIATFPTIAARALKSTVDLQLALLANDRSIYMASELHFAYSDLFRLIHPKRATSSSKGNIVLFLGLLGTGKQRLTIFYVLEKIQV